MAGRNETRRDQPVLERAACASYTLSHLYLQTLCCFSTSHHTAVYMDPSNLSCVLQLMENALCDVCLPHGQTHMKSCCSADECLSVGSVLLLDSVLAAQQVLAWQLLTVNALGLKPAAPYTVLRKQNRCQSPLCCPKQAERLLKHTGAPVSEAHMEAGLLSCSWYLTHGSLQICLILSGI